MANFTEAMVWRVVDRATAILAARGWTKRASARDKRERPVGACNPQAVCFCASGALERAEHELYGSQPNVAHCMATPALITFNDRDARTKWDVIRKLEEYAKQLCAELP